MKDHHFNILINKVYLCNTWKRLQKWKKITLPRKKTKTICYAENRRRVTTQNEENINNANNVDGYDIIDATHVAMGRGNRDRILPEASKNFAKVTEEMI